MWRMDTLALLTITLAATVTVATKVCFHQITLLNLDAQGSASTATAGVALAIIFQV